MSRFFGRLVASRVLRLHGWWLALVVLIGGCRDGSLFVKLDEARTLAAELRVQLNKANGASNRSVMADTDEASLASAREAQAATQAVNRALTELEPLLRQLALQEEVRKLEEFRTRWGKYQSLDEQILALAVENTNLKAQRLSFGPERQAADDLRDALGTVTASASAENHCRMSELATSALLDVREIQVLHASHIAELGDAKMTELEQEMGALEVSTRKKLAELAPLTGTAARPALDSALSAFERFADLSRQILALSRKNTNVRSLELALREKPALMTACDESLSALQQALAEQLSKATR